MCILPKIRISLLGPLPYDQCVRSVHSAKTQNVFLCYFYLWSACLTSVLCAKMLSTNILLQLCCWYHGTHYNLSQVTWRRHEHHRVILIYSNKCSERLSILPPWSKSSQDKKNRLNLLKYFHIILMLSKHTLLKILFSCLSKMWQWRNFMQWETNFDQ